MCVFAKYKDALGVPGEGMRRFRVLDVSAVDVAAVLVAAWLLSSSSSAAGVGVFRRAGFVRTSGGLFLLGVAAHRLFGVRTTVDKALFRG